MTLGTTSVSGGLLQGHQRLDEAPPGPGLGVTSGQTTGGMGAGGSDPPGAGMSQGGQGGNAGMATDPLGLLMQGMAQLQSAMAASMSGRVGEPEVVKPQNSQSCRRTAPLMWEIGFMPWATPWATSVTPQRLGGRRF